MTSPVYVILATYNGVEHLSTQLDSILSQSWPCYIYIFDDGSTDQTAEFINENYSIHQNLFFSVNKVRLGYVKNFEQGIKHAYNLGAEYIALSDQDDIWNPGRLEKMVTQITSDTPTLVYSDLEMIDSNGHRLHRSYLEYRGYTNRALNPEHALATALGQNGVMGNTILMNRPLSQMILPFPCNLHSHDYWISLVAQLHGKCTFIPETLVRYRIHKSNSSNSLETLAAPTKHSKPYLKRILERNYRLPYMEDSRAEILRSILKPSNPSPKKEEKKIGFDTGTISTQDERVIRRFLDYLDFNTPRIKLAYWVIKDQYIRRGLPHRVRFVIRLLLSKRYHSRNTRT